MSAKRLTDEFPIGARVKLVALRNDDDEDVEPLQGTVLGYHTGGDIWVNVECGNNVFFEYTYPPDHLELIVNPQDYG